MAVRAALALVARPSSSGAPACRTRVRSLGWTRAGSPRRFGCCSTDVRCSCGIRRSLTRMRSLPGQGRGAGLVVPPECGVAAVTRRPTYLLLFTSNDARLLPIDPLPWCQGGATCIKLDPLEKCLHRGLSQLDFKSLARCELIWNQGETVRIPSHYTAMGCRRWHAAARY